MPFAAQADSVIQIESLRKQLFTAIENVNKNKVRKLVQLYPDLVRKGFGKNNPLRAAIPNDRSSPDELEIMDILIEAEANIEDPDFFDETLLMFAISQNNFEAVVRLVKARANVNAQNKSLVSVIMIAVLALDLRILRELAENSDIDKKATNKSLNGALHWAPRKNEGGGEATEILLDNGWDPYTLNDNGYTGFMLAGSINENIEVLKVYLARHNKYPDLLDMQNKKNGNTTIIMTVLYRARKARALLISAGANLDIPNHDGDTALMLCRTRRDAEEFLDSGADYRIRNENGNTAFMTFSQKGLISLVHLFVERTDVNILEKNNNNSTAFVLVFKNNNAGQHSS